MEKLIVIPYEKYQRLLQSGSGTQSEPNMETEQKTSKETKAKTPVSKVKKIKKVPSVRLPPPGERDFKRGGAHQKKKTIDWISF